MCETLGDCTSDTTMSSFAMLPDYAKLVIKSGKITDRELEVSRF
jgi:hypothetical protein